MYVTKEWIKSLVVLLTAITIVAKNSRYFLYKVLDSYTNTTPPPPYLFIFSIYSLKYLFFANIDMATVSSRWL